MLMMLKCYCDLLHCIIKYIRTIKLSKIDYTSTLGIRYRYYQASIRSIN